jgi:hypothetical protein
MNPVAEAVSDEPLDGTLTEDQLAPDPYEDANTFFDCIFGTDDVVELRPLHHDGSTEQSTYFRSRNATEQLRALNVMSRLTRRGYCIYFGINPRKAVGGTTGEDIARFRVVAADFDEQPNLDEVLDRIGKAGLPEPTVIVFSGGGYHVYWLLSEPTEDGVKWCRCQQHIINLCDSDVVVKDKPRLLRVPGFLNHKPDYNPSPMVALVECHPDRQYAIETFLPTGDAGEERHSSKTTFPLATCPALLTSHIKKGSRHGSLFEFARKQVYLRSDYKASGFRGEIAAMTLTMAAVKCAPFEASRNVPREVDDILDWLIARRRKLEAAQGRVDDVDGGDDAAAAQDDYQAFLGSGDTDKPAAVTGYEAHGLKKCHDDKDNVDFFTPGDWQVATVNSDPPEIQLTVPAWRNSPCRGIITLAMDEYLSPTRVSEKVFAATQRIILAENPKKWAGIWNGFSIKKGENGPDVHVSGLKTKLMELATTISVNEASKRYATLAQMLLEHLSRASAYDAESHDPHPNGKPVWVTPDELWFSWSKSWLELKRTQDFIGDAEIRDLKKRLCGAAGLADVANRRFEMGGRRLSFVAFNVEWLEALQRLADGDD